MIAHRADVVVCDGFVGNVVIKFFEGLTSYIFRALREDLQQGPLAPLALLALKPGFDRLRARFDYESYGGAPLLGVKGVSIVTHGRAKARMIENAIRVASESAQARVPELIGDGRASTRRSRIAACDRASPPGCTATSLTVPTGTRRGRKASAPVCSPDGSPSSRCSRRSSGQGAQRRRSSGSSPSGRSRTTSATMRPAGRGSLGAPRRARRADRRRSTPDPGSRARSSRADDPPERDLRGAILRRDPERGDDA